MKDKNLIVALSMLATPLAFAGSMGTTPTSTPYLSLEGSYTWPDVEVHSVNGNNSTYNKNGWGGRLSAGLIRSYTEKTSLTAEFGGGYYGKINFDNTPSGISGKWTYSGYDFLVGGIYKLRQLNLFLNIGAMLQNADLYVERDRTKLFLGSGSSSLINGTTTNKVLTSAMLPEIKVGGFYNVHNNLDVSLAYMHVFGYSNQSNTNVSGTGDRILLNGSVDHVNPSLDSLMLGVRYNFV